MRRARRPEGCQGLSRNECLNPYQAVLAPPPAAAYAFKLLKGLGSSYQLVIKFCPNLIMSRSFKGRCAGSQAVCWDLTVPRSGAERHWIRDASFQTSD